MFILSVLSFLLVSLVFMFFMGPKSYLSSLLILESMVLVSLVMLISFFWVASYCLFLFILLLTLSVCEAGLGLSLLLSYMKTSGNDSISAIETPGL
uniref:NADH dehydrogenase subunit 4L n=1 Tax=Megalophaedusa oxycyma TaxID=1885873 RepID=A0A224AA48_9EUPU|nr:NADH dehydrogenase subunit 4L [Megalophaedusa oxycyma]